MDVPVPQFEQSLETDLRSLADEIRRNRENEALKSASERELVKEAIRAFPRLEKTPVPSPSALQAAPAPAAPSAAAVVDPLKNPLPDYAQNAAPEVKLEIEYLLEVALTKGVGKALNESEKSPYFVQDAFHDALAGKLYPELQKRGIVK